MDQPTIHPIVAATNNAHKLSEIRPLIEPDFRILSLSDIGCTDELPETRDTLEGNSLQKAEYIFNKYNLPCFADDTGLEVEALGGEPGVFSARYAGSHRNSADNMALLLQKLKGEGHRKAVFRTVITLMGMGPTRTFEGRIMGQILTAPRGSEGFGYDPVFCPDGFSTSFAEMTLAEKNRLSHRARAVQALIRFLKQFQAAR